MKSNFTYNIIQKAIMEGYSTIFIESETNYDKLWENVKREIIQDNRKRKLEELFPDLKINENL
jgi:hypothetical protein